MSTADHTFCILQCIKFMNSFIQSFIGRVACALRQYCSIRRRFDVIVAKCDYNSSFPQKKRGMIDLLFTLPVILTSLRLIFSALTTGSGRVFSGYGIWPKCSPGFGKKQNILTRFGILMLSSKQDSLKFGHGTRKLFSVCREIGKLLWPKNTFSDEKIKAN